MYDFFKGSKAKCTLRTMKFTSVQWHQYFLSAKAVGIIMLDAGDKRIMVPVIKKFAVHRREIKHVDK